MLPHIMGTGEFLATVADSLVDINDCGVFADGGGIQQAVDAVLRRLAACDHLASIGDCPNCHMLADQVLSTEGK